MAGGRGKMLRKNPFVSRHCFAEFRDFFSQSFSSLSDISGRRAALKFANIASFSRTGVCVGGRVRVAAERRGESRALHAVRGADGPPECGHQQDRVAAAVGDQRREAYRLHRHDAVHRAM